MIQFRDTYQDLQELHNTENLREFSERLINDYQVLKTEYKLLRSSNIAREAVIKDLQDTITELEAKVSKLKSKLYVGQNLDTYSEWAKKAPHELEAAIQGLAAAYYLESNIPPDKAVLEVGPSEDGKKFYYWFRNITDIKDRLQAIEKVVW